MDINEAPLPWRTGTNVTKTIHDASPVGDGGKPGKSLGRMDTPELAARVVAAVNDVDRLRCALRDVVAAFDAVNTDGRGSEVLLSAILAARRVL